MSKDKEVKLINPEALDVIGVYLICPVSSNEDSIFYKVFSLSKLESSFKSLLGDMEEIKALEYFLKPQTQATSLLDVLASRMAEKLLKLPQASWPRMIDKELKNLSKLKAFDAEYFIHKLTALIH